MDAEEQEAVDAAEEELPGPELITEPSDVAKAFAEAGGEEYVPPVTEQTEPGEDVQPLVTECGFYVYIREDGHWVADSENTHRPMVIGRKATFDDFQIATHVVGEDVLIQKTAQTTIMFQQQTAAAMAQQMQGQALAQQLAREGKIPGMRGGVPLGGGLVGGGAPPNRHQRRHPNG